MNTPTLKTAIFAAETVAHLHSFEHEILPLTDLAREMDAEIGRLRTDLESLTDAVISWWKEHEYDECCGLNIYREDPEFVTIAQRLLLQKPARPETPQSAREMDAEIGRLRKTLAELHEYTNERCASYRNALTEKDDELYTRIDKILYKPAPPETPQSARPRKCLDDNSRLHD